MTDSSPIEKTFAVAARDHLGKLSSWRVPTDGDYKQATETVRDALEEESGQIPRVVLSSVTPTVPTLKIKR